MSVALVVGIAGAVLAEPFVRRMTSGGTIAGDPRSTLRRQTTVVVIFAVAVAAADVTGSALAG